MGFLPRGQFGITKAAISHHHIFSLWRRARRKLFTAYGRNKHKLNTLFRQNDLSDEAFLKSLSAPCSDAADFHLLINQSISPIFFINAEHRDRLVLFIRDHFPDCEALTIKAADKACAHVFDLLGSRDSYLGSTIDWHIDFKSGHRWEPNTYYADIRYAPYPGGYDIKVPWELSRCQHFVWFGQAYLFTNDDKYAKEFVAEVEDWIAKNPWPLGVNWSCTMDVAIRAINWLWGYYLLKESKILDEHFCVKLHKSLMIHGRHILRNLENVNVSPNNHYLSNLAGLIYLGVLCPFFSESTTWLEHGLKELWKEIFRQVHPDGVNFEGSIAYHRFATELYLSVVVLCQANGISVPAEVMERIEKMIEYVMYYTKPDGTVPIIGDADNGRLHRLTVWADKQREWIDHRYLLAIGAVLFKRVDFAVSSEKQWEEAFWMMGARAQAVLKELADESVEPLSFDSKYFPDGGVAVLRHEDLYLFACIGREGNRSRPMHGHNDLGSLELFSDGISWLIDPGAYIYTADYNARHLFRSTAYHNTVQIDDNEIADISEQNPFYVGKGPDIHLLNWQCTETHSSISFEFLRKNDLEDFIVVRRSIGLDKTKRLWTIRDLIKIDDNNPHRVVWSWHFSPCVQLKLSARNSLLVVSNDGNALAMKWTGALSLKVATQQKWISMSYGNIRNASLVHLQYYDTCDNEISLTTLIGNPCSLNH
jgi:uncharacterized heparinase superfamily protein